MTERRRAFDHFLAPFPYSGLPDPLARLPLQRSNRKRMGRWGDVSISAGVRGRIDYRAHRRLRHRAANDYALDEQ